MKTRTDQLAISLGPDAIKRKRYLKSLALDLNEAGRQGDGSISAILILLSELCEAGARDVLVAGITAARNVANGGDEWDTLTIMKKFLPPVKTTTDDI